ncbi:YceI family protein [Bacteriovorax sp. Seq25_V]|uniref:YceI family protein n=1 Tax=Bacteriovorax sp. Seq25_V TaxID=1201288 RepID=UPI00038A531B|nr:YceI family protein [Bacteriovorax sp. Seq25_V]EQC45450.1 YceI-like domain protein [Bacteriovorax sp. Seq25_V]
MKHLILSAVLFGLSNMAFADKSFSVDTSASKLEWTGKKVTGQHVGTIDFKSGTVVLDDNGVLKAANFVADMTTISATDLEGEWKGKLDGHLKNDDFFATDKNPEAKMSLKKIISKKGDKYEVEADLTVKGITSPVKFNVDLSNKAKPVLAGNLTFDRTKFNVKYNSGSFFEGLGDKMIYNDVDLKFSVKTK